MLLFFHKGDFSFGLFWGGVCEMKSNIISNISICVRDVNILTAATVGANTGYISALQKH